MSENPFEKLRAQLEQEEWPNVYFFKFIVKNNQEAVRQVKQLFYETAEVSTNQSKTGKFISVGAKMMMLDVDSILSIYNKAQKIPGIISL